MIGDMNKHQRTCLLISLALKQNEKLLDIVFRITKVNSVTHDVVKV